MKTILLWDQRYPDRPPHRMTVNDTFASAAVRSGFAAPVDPADFVTLNVGGALDPSTPTEITLEDSVSKRMRRIAVPASVAAVAVSLGVGASIGKPIGATPAPTPTLGTPTLSGSLTQGTPASGVSLSGLTDGSTVTFNISGLSVGTSGTSRTVSGTPASSGALTVTETLAGATGSPKGPTSVGTVAASGGSTTFAFPAVQSKMASGQRPIIAIVGDSAVAGWGSGVATGTGTGTGPGNPGNYSRDQAWPQQLARLLTAAGIPTRADAFNSSASDTNTTNLQSAQPKLILGTGWILGNTGLGGTILQAPSGVTTSTTVQLDFPADAFDFACSVQSTFGQLVVSDSSGWSQLINCQDISGAQSLVGSNGLKRFTVQRPTASLTPITITRNGVGGTSYIQLITPYNTQATTKELELWNIGWPGSRAYGTDNTTTHWNIYSTPANMNASTPFNALSVLNNADAIILELGTNDAKNGIAAADIQTALTNIATKLVGMVGAANVALVKPRTATDSYNMSPDQLAAIDNVTANLGLKPIINFNAINFVTADRFDGTHLSQQGYAKEAAVAKTWLLGS